MGKSSKATKRSFRKEKTGPSAAYGAATSASQAKKLDHHSFEKMESAATASATKQNKRIGKRALRSGTGGLDTSGLGGADYVDLLLGSRGKARNAVARAKEAQ